MHTEERGVQTYFPKVVKSFRTVATQTDNNIAINILNNKKEHPEDMNILDHNYGRQQLFNGPKVHVNLP